MTPNVAAFLEMIAFSEGTDRSPDPYRCCYGYRHTITDLSEHPAVDRPGVGAEWGGESLASLGDAYKHSISTAAGKYQITRPTWQSIQVILHLPDFTKPCQDDAAIFLIKEKGALTLVNGGEISQAIMLCHGIWASLPGSNSGQPQKTAAALMQSYMNNGGGFA